MKLGRGFGLVLFTALLLVLLAFSVAITQPYISDTDPSTYIIVPMLMLPVFALLMFKNSGSMVPKVDSRSMVLGVILFAAFIFIALNTRGYLGPLFFTYRIDMLLMPIAIMALASLIFGVSNLDRFVWIALYSLFASPLILLPIINLNLNFASLNTLAIYYISGIFLHGISFVSPITLYFNGESVSIGNTCIGIGALIGIVMFLLPIAYFLEGSRKNRAIWVLSGLALMLILNFLRMLLITMAWFFYGPSNNLLDLHSVAGQLIFYAVIVVMIFAVGMYRLEYPRLELGKRHEYGGAALLVALAFCGLYFLTSISYLNAAAIPIASLSYNATLDLNSAVTLYSTYISYNGNSYNVVGEGNSSIAIVLVNSTDANYSAMAIFGQPNASASLSVLNNRSTVGWKEYLHADNISYVYQEDSAPTVFLYRSAVPYASGGRSYMLDMYVAEPMPITKEYPRCEDMYAYFYDTLANLAALNPYTFDSSIDNGYCMINEVLK